MYFIHEYLCFIYEFDNGKSINWVTEILISYYSKHWGENDLKLDFSIVIASKKKLFRIISRK